jgi:hypothetical protein
MKNSAYFQQMSKSRFKHKAVRPKQKNLFYLKTKNANFSLLNRKQQVRLVKEINRLFSDSHHMIDHWAHKLNLSVKNSEQGMELIIP